MDPFTVLGVPRTASADEVAEAYRRLAKQWHPDRGGGEPAARRMAEINAAYESLRRRRFRRRAPERPAAARRRRQPGWWLPARARRALGPELLAALQTEEDVVLVTPAATWASPRTRLALTDRRLLWLHEDAIGHRVRWLRLDAIEDAEERLSWPRRRNAVLRIREGSGRRTSFAEVRPSAARTIVAHVRGRRAAAAPAAGAQT